MGVGSSPFCPISGYDKRGRGAEVEALSRTGGGRTEGPSDT